MHVIVMSYCMFICDLICLTALNCEWVSGKSLVTLDVVLSDFILVKSIELDLCLG